MVRIIRTVLLALALVAGSVAVTPQAAQAANGCGGVYLGSRTLTSRATVDVYLENGTTNCVALRTVGSWYGRATWMGVGIGGQNSVSQCNYPDTLNVNQVVCGNYRYWVGGARQYAPHSCISIWARVQFDDGYGYYTTFWNQFCE